MKEISPSFCPPPLFLQPSQQVTTHFHLLLHLYSACLHIKMGNCLALCDPSLGSTLAKQGSIVRVAKPDGKILKFTTPIAVKQILQDFPDFVISVSEEASQPLSPDHRLKPTTLYHLLPHLSSLAKRDAGSGIKRVKIVITKQRLQQLVDKKISLEDVISDVQSRTVDLPSNWRPQLDSIPEGNE